MADGCTDSEAPQGTQAYGRVQKHLRTQPMTDVTATFTINMYKNAHAKTERASSVFRSASPSRWLLFGRVRMCHVSVYCFLSLVGLVFEQRVDLAVLFVPGCVFRC